MSREPSRSFATGVKAFLLFATLTAFGCGRDGEDAATMGDTDSALAGGSPAPELQLRSSVADFSGRGVAGAAANSPLPSVPQGADQPGQMLIRNGDVSVRVDSLELAMEAVRGIATGVGGTVGNVSVSTGDFQVRSATMQLRVPSERFDEAMGGLAPLGKVEHSSTTVQDVGEEFVDVSVRVANSKRLEARLVELLGSRTGTLEDVLAVERELARVREEIERREGRLRFLSARVAMSTLNVTVSEGAPVVGSTPGRSVIGQAFIGAWRNFVGFVAWVIESLGIVIPAALVVWAVVRLARRRKRRADPA